MKRKRASYTTTFETTMVPLQNGVVVKRRIYLGGPGIGLAITGGIEASREFALFQITHVASGRELCERKGLEKATDAFQQLVHVTEWTRTIEDLRADHWVKRCVEAVKAGRPLPKQPPAQQTLTEFA